MLIPFENVTYIGLSQSKVSNKIETAASTLIFERIELKIILILFCFVVFSVHKFNNLLLKSQNLSISFSEEVPFYITFDMIANEWLIAKPYIK